MMSFKGYLFQACSILVVLVVLCMTPSNARLNEKASSKIITAVCSKAMDRSYCLQLLESTPGAATADLKGLGKITIDLARSRATNTLRQLNSLISKAADPKLKKAYQSCSEHYDNAIGDLQDSETDLNKRDYFGMNVQAAGAMTEADDCDDETTGLRVDPSIKKGNQDLDHIADIILVVSNLLKGS